MTRERARRRVDRMAGRHAMMAAGLACLLVAAPACTRIKDTKGYISDESLTAQIMPGTDNAESVRRLLGRPSLESDYEGKTWYYISRKTEQLAFLWPEAEEHDVLVVTFGANDAVTSVTKLGKDQVADVSPADGATPTRGRTLGFWEQLLGDLGRYSGG